MENSGFWYKLRLWRRDYLRLQDLFHFATVICAALLATFSYSSYPQVTLVLGLIYLLASVAGAVSTIRNRKARDQVQAEVLWGLFSLINKEIFKGDHRTRFTLFREDSFRPHHITPWYRYFKGGKGPIEEATRSTALYKREEGLTGQAWAEAGHSLLCQVLPEFQTRQQFEDYYINKLGIQQSTVGKISNYMVAVQTVFCYAFVGGKDRTLGVLSLDFRTPLILDPDDHDGNPLFSSPEGDHDVVLDRGHFRLLLSTVQNVLESFVESERRRT